MIDLLLSSLEDYLNSKKDLLSGCADEATLIEAKKRFVSSLGELVSYQVALAMDKRREKSSISKMQIAESLQNQMRGTVTSLKAMGALNCAPSPLDESNFSDEKMIKIWFDAYKGWFERERNNGLMVG